MLQAVLVTLSGYNSPHIEFNDGTLPQTLPQPPIGDLATYNKFQKQRQRLSYRVKFTEQACNILGITPSEQDMLQQVLILAVYTKKLESFVQVYGKQLKTCNPIITQLPHSRCIVSVYYL